MQFARGVFGLKGAKDMMLWTDKRDVLMKKDAISRFPIKNSRGENMGMYLNLELLRGSGASASSQSEPSPTGWPSPPSPRRMSTMQRTVLRGRFSRLLVVRSTLVAELFPPRYGFGMIWT